MLRVLAFLSVLQLSWLSAELTRACAADEKKEGKKEEKKDEKEKKAEKKASAPAHAPEDPSVDKLLELNAREVFGVPVAVKGGRVTLRFTEKGSFNRGFRSASAGLKGFIANHEEIKDPTMRGNVSGGGLEGAFSFAALDSGEAVSRFEMADDFTVSFRVRSHNVPPGSSLIVRVNQEDPKSFIQTSFFQDLTVFEGGRPRRVASKDARITMSPPTWLNKRPAGVEAIPVKIEYKDRKVSLAVTLLEGKDKPVSPPVEVLYAGADKPGGGRIVFKFAKLSFGVADLVIDGKYKKEWAEAEISKLRKDRKLRLKPEEPEVVAKSDDKPGEGRAKGKRGEKRGPEPEKKPRRDKKPPPNVDTPDPEAEVDL